MDHNGLQQINVATFEKLLSYLFLCRHVIRLSTQHDLWVQVSSRFIVVSTATISSLSLLFFVLSYRSVCQFHFVVAGWRRKSKSAPTPATAFSKQIDSRKFRLVWLADERGRGGESCLGHPLSRIAGSDFRLVRKYDKRSRWRQPSSANSMLWKVVLIGQLLGFHAIYCANDERPTLTPDTDSEDGGNIFDQILKKNKESSDSLGRTVGAEKLVQGDIAVSNDAEELEKLRKLGRTTAQHNVVLIWPRKLWRTREIPYIFDGLSTNEQQKVHESFNIIQSKTCLKYRPRRSTDRAWIRVYRSGGCWANIGRSIGFGETKVNLGCSLSPVLGVHELVHALGFFHEQARRDRDNYVKIMLWNVSPANKYNFDKANRHEMDYFGQPYDYKSIMHYSRTSFTRNGQNTIQAKHDPALDLGGKVLSKYDIAKINAMYHCHEKAGAVWTEWSDWSPCLKNWKGCYRSKHRICLANSLSQCPEADDFGVHSKPQKCPTEAHCNEATDGFWGQWGSWSRCNKACDRGTKVRHRKCDSPSPKNGGKACSGAKSDTEKCMLKRCRSNGLDANFESGLGMWTNVNTYKDPLNWQRGRGQVNRDSGPTGDHTTGYGWYLYVSSKGYNHQKQATIASRLFTGTNCISLAYQMNGKNMGHLVVYAQRVNREWMLFPGGKIKGHQGKGWKHAEFTAGDTSSYGQKAYKLYIEAKTGYGPHSDIAIDDVFIDKGKCGCKDRHKSCVGWAKEGECHLNPHMLTLCCSACKSMGECSQKEYSNECAFWARIGECHLSPRWMWKNCCKSCKLNGCGKIAVNLARVKVNVGKIKTRAAMIGQSKETVPTKHTGNGCGKTVAQLVKAKASVKTKTINAKHGLGEENARRTKCGCGKIVVLLAETNRTLKSD
eukprot:gene15793-17386_t